MLTRSIYTGYKLEIVGLTGKGLIEVNHRDIDVLCFTELVHGAYSVVLKASGTQRKVVRNRPRSI